MEDNFKKVKYLADMIDDLVKLNEAEVNYLLSE